MKFVRFGKILATIARWQIQRPWIVLGLALLSLIPAGYSASKLQLRTSFSELLPDNKPSVVELRRVNQRLLAQATLTVVAEASGPDILKAYVDAIAPKIAALGPEYVSGVDVGPKPIEDFLRQRKHLYAPLRDLQQLRDEVVEYFDSTVARSVGFDLGLDDGEEESKPSPPIEKPHDGATTETEKRLHGVLARLKQQEANAENSRVGRDGYYLGEEGKLIALLVRTSLGSGDPKAFELQRRIAEMTKELGFEGRDSRFRIHFTGNLITSAEAQRSVIKDLTEVGALGVAFVLGIVFLFFLRIRTVLAMTLTIALGLVWSFGAAQLTVGYLNTATGFLVSIIAGNGINFGIIFMARYIEARRDEKLNVPDAILVSQQDTWSATLAAAGAAMIAYGSLAITDFRGFRHFGIIGGAGMLLCWAGTYALLPVLLVISERVRPMFEGEAPWRRHLRGYYGVPFAWAVRRGPRFLSLFGLGLGVIGTVLSVLYFAHDPMEYDMRKIGNDRTSPTSASMLSVRVDRIVGRLGQDGRAIVLDRIDQVAPLVTELERRLEAAPTDKKPFDKVVSIFNLIPKDQPKKLELLSEIKDRLSRARAHGAIGDVDWERIKPELPDSLSEVGVDDLPEAVARPFMERSGRRGTIVYIVPRTGRSVYDAHYLFQFADAFREIRLPNGEVIRGSGDPVIFSDMLINVGEDAPKAIAISLLGTLLVILLAFRGRASAWAALGALLIGMVWLIGIFYLLEIRLNFLNFVAIPISIGVGADYALNIMKRREIVGQQAMDRLLVETGGAVVLCSLTTQLGYFALLSSINGAVRSFGLAAALGEITTLLAAALALPAWLGWLRQKHDFHNRRGRTNDQPSGISR